jgi:Ala-tRNA(Pro) deacylase
LLADGTPPMSSDALLAALEDLQIRHRTVDHPAVHTVDEARALRIDLPGVHTKNLFLRNRKGRMWLVTLLADRVVDLKDLGARIGAGRVSFASHQRLMHYLGLRPGAVNPFAVANDIGGAVQLVLDADVLAGEDIWVHPLVNTRTTGLSPDDLLRYLRSVDHEPAILRFE